jgi:uncharacterized protein YndB with AHSA1/START domain
METTTPTRITVEAIINAPVEKVWNYYNGSEHITKWNQADPSWHCPSATVDLRIGGKSSSRMEAKDGSFGFDFNTIYTAVETNKHIAYKMEDGRVCTIDFVPEGNSTKMNIVFDAESQNPVEMQKGGWQSILNSFKNYTENN